MSPIRIGLTLGATALLLFLLALYALVASYVYLEPSLPSADNLRNVPVQVPLRIYSRGGDLIAQIGEQRRIPVTYDQIPELVRDAFVAAEDEHFFEHHGFDYSGVLRAIFVDLTSGDFSQGASTITMQAARNMFLTLDKTLKRKLQEVFLTYRMEHEFTKQQILDTYLNVIFFGQRAYGVAAASEAYFGKPLSELSVAEAATLAGIPKAPSRYNPVTNPKAATNRRHYVLTRMVKNHFIDAATARRADHEPMDAREHAPLYEVEAPYVAEMARADLVSRYGADAVNAGYKVYTTIDGRLQTAANRAVRLGLIEYDRRKGYRGPLRQLPALAAAAPAAIDKALADIPDIPDIGLLRAALVVSVAQKSARVYVRSGNYAQIDWDGLSWARKHLSDTRIGNAPREADDVVHRGDVVYVVANGHGVAQLAQLPEAQGALVSLDPNDGAISALVGGFNYFGNQFNRVTQAKLQPGSGFKPFLYSAALEHGFTPSSIVLDSPIVYDESTGQEKSWRPENFEHEFGGPTRLREALVQSLNLVTIRMLRQMGTDYAIDYATRFGFTHDELPDNLTLALGTASVTPLQIATGYATFANNGYQVNPYFIDRIENAAGQVVYSATPKRVCENCEPPAPPVTVDATPGAGPGTAAPGAAPTVTSVAGAAPAAGATGAVTATPTAAPATAATSALVSTGDNDGVLDSSMDAVGSETAPSLIPPAQRAPRVISADNAWLLDDMMGDVIRRGTGQRARVLGRNDIDGKTGTSQDSQDAWFNGFNRNIVTSVWVGFDLRRSLGANEQGATAALPIWIDFMREALRDVPDLPRPLPPGLVTLRISKQTGLVAGANASDSDTMEETYMADHLPAAAAPGLNPNGSATPGSGEPIF